MNVPAGNMEYTLGHPPVTGCGVSWSQEELDAALAGPVLSLVFDRGGTADIEALLEGLPSTDFERDELAKTLEGDERPENWEVGESIAEAYLTHQRDSFFPWPHGRDIRKPRSSLPGADIIGFHGRDEEARFALSEVKTSAEERYPPQVVRYGEHSLNQQLLDLRDQRALRDRAVMYLGHRAVHSAWEPTYRSAAINYLKSGGTGVVLFGVLIRDVPPASADLAPSWRRLSEDSPDQTVIELWAVYLPVHRIDSLSEKVLDAARGGDA